MIKIEAETLAEAYSKASAKLECSVTQISINVIQNPSSGFLGMFKKTAIIEAEKIGAKKEVKQTNNKPNVKSNIQAEVSEDKPRKSRNRRNKNKKKEKVIEKINEKTTINKDINNTNKQVNAKEEPRVEKHVNIHKPRFEKKFLKPKVDVNIAVPEIRKNVNALFKHSCFTLDEVKVEVYNENTVLIEFGGEDSALLIGKEGYRYKSLSYLLYNWISIKYNLNVRLEIAEFLKKQEEMIGKYLIGVIERVNNAGRAQTKILDGVLVKIALEALRKEFPNKYVGIKSGREGGRFIVINDFNRKTS